MQNSAYYFGLCLNTYNSGIEQYILEISFKSGLERNHRARRIFPLLILPQLFTVRTFCSPLCTAASPRMIRPKITAKAAAAAATLAAGVSALAPSSPPVRTRVMQAEERWRRRGGGGGAASIQLHLVDLVASGSACEVSQTPVSAVGHLLLRGRMTCVSPAGWLSHRLCR